MTTSDTIECPFCRETIKVGAQKCRFCGEWLTSSHSPRYISISTLFSQWQRIWWLEWTVLSFVGIIAFAFFFIYLEKLFHNSIVTWFIQGLILSTLQWIMLNRYDKQAFWWIIGNLAAFSLLGFIVEYFLSEYGSTGISQAIILYIVNYIVGLRRLKRYRSMSR